VKIHGGKRVRWLGGENKEEKNTRSINRRTISKKI
jgi:hypothetical protein